MPAKRCSLCGIDWPQQDEYSECPSCQERTHNVRNVEAMDEDEARSLKNEFDFERYYTEWDAARPWPRPDGPDTPIATGVVRTANIVGRISEPEKPV